jgi:hypothetical protein
MMALARRAAKASDEPRRIKEMPKGADEAMRKTMVQAEDGYVNDHVAATFHAVHYSARAGGKTLAPGCSDHRESSPPGPCVPLALVYRRRRSYSS